jgi:predicted DCC family thiol-disulfide oxidoreductase YuxK
VLVYDADCGFCAMSARWLATRFVDDAKVEPWQGLDLADLQLTVENATTAAYWLDGGARWRGHRAIGVALLHCGRPWRWVGRVLLTRPVGWVAAPVYAWVARNRHRMPGGTDRCAL